MKIPEVEAPVARVQEPAGHWEIPKLKRLGTSLMGEQTSVNQNYYVRKKTLAQNI